MANDTPPCAEEVMGIEIGLLRHYAEADSIARDDITPLLAVPLPPVCFGLLTQVKSYKILAV